MVIPAFIAANPGLSLSIASTLAKLGSGLLGRNDAKDAMNKAEEENRKIMAQANLRQAFGGNPSVEMVQPKLDPGFGTTLLSRIGDAAGLASQAYGLYDAKKLRDLQKLNVQGQMDSRQLADDITRGATLGAGSTLPQTSTIAPKLSAPVTTGGRAGRTDPSRFMPQQTPPIASDLRVSPADITMGGSVAPGGLSDVGQAAFSAAQNEQIAARAAAQSAAQQQAWDNQQALNKQFLEAADLDLRLKIFQDKTANLNQLSQKDRMSAERALAKDFNALTKNFRAVGDSFNTIMAGAENPTAASDLSLIFAFMKMLDPTSTVRESEFAQVEQAGALPDKVQNIIGRFWDGQRLTVNRPIFLSQAKNLYDARLPAYANIADNYTAIAGRENLDARNIVMDYTVNLDRFDEILKNSQALEQSPTGSGSTHAEILSFLEGYEPNRMAPGTGVYRRRGR